MPRRLGVNQKREWWTEFVMLDAMILPVSCPKIEKRKSFNRSTKVPATQQSVTPPFIPTHTIDWFFFSKQEKTKVEYSIKKWHCIKEAEQQIYSWYPPQTNWNVTQISTMPSPTEDERKMHLDQSQQIDDSIVYENDDDDDASKKGCEEDTKNIKQMMISPSKSTATNVTTPTSPDGGSFVQDWNVVESHNDSSSEFSDAEYQLDLLEEGAIDEEKIINQHDGGIIISSICSIDSDDGSCSDFADDGHDDELLEEDNDLPSSNNLVAEDEFDSDELAVVVVVDSTTDKNTKGVEASVVIENPPSVGDSSDFEDEEDDDSLCLGDGVVVAEDGAVVVVDDDHPSKNVAGKDSATFLVPPMRQRPRLNSLIRSGVEGRAAK